MPQGIDGEGLFTRIGAPIPLTPFPREGGTLF